MYGCYDFASLLFRRTSALCELRSRADDNPYFATVFHFFELTDDRSQFYEAVRNLVIQLAEQNELAQALVEETLSQSDSSSIPTAKVDLASLLVRMTDVFERVYIFLDELDVLGKSDYQAIEGFIEMLCQPNQSSPVKLHFFVASRLRGLGVGKIENRFSVKVENEQQSGDIERFLHQPLKSTPAFARNDSLTSQIVEHVISARAP